MFINVVYIQAKCLQKSLHRFSYIFVKLLNMQIMKFLPRIEIVHRNVNKKLKFYFVFLATFSTFDVLKPKILRNKTMDEKL